MLSKDSMYSFEMDGLEYSENPVFHCLKNDYFKYRISASKKHWSKSLPIVNSVVSYMEEKEEFADISVVCQVEEYLDDKTLKEHENYYGSPVISYEYINTKCYQAHKKIKF